MDYAMESGDERANDGLSTLSENKLDVWNETFKLNGWNGFNYSGSDNATEAEEINPFYFYETEQLAFLWILFVLIIVGNAAVLLALSMSKARKSRMNYFIMHLAIADLSVGLISVLTDVIWKITVSWNAGNAACKIIRFAQVLVTYSSTYVLVALSIDRYDAITHPMNFTRGWRRARILIATAWLVSGLFAAPTLLLYEEKLVDGKMQCWIELSSDLHWQVYITLVTVALFVLPALLISACYVVIVHTIWSKSGAMTTRPAHKLKNGIMANQRSNEVDDDQDSRRASSRGIIPKAKIKTVKMTFVIVFMFILCWSPYFVYDLVQVFGHIPKTQTMTAVSTFIQSMAPLNSAANPLIYCLFSTHICRNLRKIPAMEWLASKLESTFRLSRWIPCLSPASASSGDGQFTRTFRTTTTRLSSDVSLPTVRKNLSRIDTGVSVSGKRGPSPCSTTRISGTTSEACGQHPNEPLLVCKSREWV